MMNQLSRLCAMLLVAAVVACATTPSPADQAAQIIPVRVENDLTNRGDVSVRIIDSTGASRLLGGAPPASIRDFSYHDQLLAGTYRLRAETGDGRTIQSRSFTLFPGAAVVWALQRNVLQVVTRGSIEDFDA